MMLCKANLPNRQARQDRLQGVQNLMIVLHPSQAASKARLHGGISVVHRTKVAEMMSKLNEDQRREFVHNYHLGSLLDIKLRSSGHPSLLKWLYDHIDPQTMILKVGPGKEIKLTKEVVQYILGVPSKGQSLVDNASYTAKVNEAKRLRSELKVANAKDFTVQVYMERIEKGGIDDLTKRCFFLVLFNRLFFSTPSWAINNSEIGKTMNMSNFDDIDWCHMIYLDLCQAVTLWHQKIDEDQTAYTIWGCSTVILLYYLDWLDHPAGPEDRFRTPRISMFTSDMVTNLSRADVVHEGQAIACYGTLNFRPPAQTCYMAAPDLGSIYVPKLSKLLAGKIAALRGRTRRQFEEVCTVYDQDVDRQCQTIQSALNNIVEKQHNMVTTFGYLIDEVLQADGGEEDDDNEAAHGLSAQADHGHHGLQTDLNQAFSPNASENGIVIEALDIVAPPEFSQAQSSSAPHHETINKEPEDHEQQTVVGNLGQGQCTDHRQPTSHTHTAQMHDDQGEEGTQADMSQLSSTQLSTLANASLFSDSQIENMNDQLFEQQEARKQKLTNDMGDDQDNQDGSPSRFLNLSNDESVDVRKNLAHHGDEADGEDNGRLFNVNPRVTEALNDVTHIFSGLADINDVSQNGPPHFDYTPQQQGPSFDHTPASRDDSVPQKPDVIPLQCLNTQRIIENCYERSAALLNLLTSTDLTFKDSIICRFGDDNSRAGEVRAYFAPRKDVADSWIQYYVHCLMKDEPKNRLLRKEYEQIYLDFNVMRYIYQEGNAYGDEVVEYRQAILISTLDRFLPDQHLLKGVREIVVRFVRNRHFSVYVVNFKHHRVDILDPNPWNLIGDGWKETHKGTVKYGNSKGQWCKIMMKRLNEAIQAARPDSGIPKFGNYKCEMLDGIHKQKIGSNDYGFYCMWYMEYYNASTAKVLWPYSASSEQIRADVLQYIIFHEAKEQKELPEEIEQLRPPY